MAEILSRYTDALSSDSVTAYQMIKNIWDRIGTQNTNSGGLAINAGGATTAKTVNTIYYICNGVHGSAAAATLPALAGTISAGKYNVFVLNVDAAGTFTWSMGTEGGSAAAVKFPPPVVGKAIVGYLLVTYASAFTGGTTPLDTATTVYVNVTGPFDPTMQL